MKRNFVKIFKPRKNREILLLALLVVALGRIWIQHVNVINNFGRIENLTVKMVEVTNREPHKKTAELKETALNEKNLNQNSISCSFTYLKPGEDIPRLNSEQLSKTSRNPVIRIYNKVAELCRLQRELNGLPSLPTALIRPTSMQLQCPPDVSEESGLQVIEKDIDENLARVKETLADNPIETELAFVQQ